MNTKTIEPIIGKIYNQTISTSGLARILHRKNITPIQIAELLQKRTDEI